MKDNGSIRSLQRGLDILQVVSRQGSATLTEIAQITGLPYPTVFRIVLTLEASGYIEKEPARKRYRSTVLTKSLSSGYQESSQLISASRPHLENVTKELGWPVSVATRVGNMMMVRDCTHKRTTMTLAVYDPGYTLPLGECSSGKAYLAFCDDRERDSIRAGLEKLAGPADKYGLVLMSDDHLFEKIRSQGYATQVRNSYTSNPGKTSSIAVPVLHEGVVLGSLAIIFFSAGMGMVEAEARFVGRLKQAALDIERDFSAAVDTDMLSAK